MAAQSRGKRLIVIGGGIAGLSYVHYLRNFLTASKKTHLIDKIILLESSKHMGGSIKTKTFEDNHIHERGPRSVRSVGVRSKNTVTLLEQLGLTDQVVGVNKTSIAARSRHIYNNGKMDDMDTRLTRIYKKMPGSKTRVISAFAHDIFKAPKLDLNKFPHRDPSVYEFFAHRFGAEAAENVADPLLRGITAGDCRKISSQAMFGDLVAREQAYGNLVIGMSRAPVTQFVTDDLFPNDVLCSKLLEQFSKDNILSWTLKNGLQTLPERLSNSLLNTNEDGKVAIHINTPVQSIEMDDHRKESENPCRVHVKTVDGDHIKLEADHIIAALPSVQLGELTKSLDEIQQSVFKGISAIPHVPVGCVTVEYRNMEGYPHILNSFGFLTHSKSKCRVLGISFDSGLFPSIDKPFNSIRMTCMIGGAWMEEMVGTSDLNRINSTTLEQIALDEIRRILGIRDDPFRVSSYLWKIGIANYAVGHKTLMEKTREEIKQFRLPITLLGQSYDGIAVNDVIWNARLAANSFVKSLQT